MVCPSFVSTESDYETLPGASLPTKSFDFWEGVLVREPFAVDLPRSIELANTTFTTPRPLQEDGDECFERRNFERREREVASNFNVDAYPKGRHQRFFSATPRPSLELSEVAVIVITLGWPGEKLQGLRLPVPLTTYTAVQLSAVQLYSSGAGGGSLSDL